MIASFLLSFREGLEAALIVGIVLAALRKMELDELSSSVWLGVAAAVGMSILAGLGLSWLGAELEGRGEAIFEGMAMTIAAVLLTWMILWMRRQSVNLQSSMEGKVSHAAAGSRKPWALFWLAFLAVGREGVELVLFLTAVEMGSGALQTMLGTLVGLCVAVALGWGLFTSSKRMSLRFFFNVTNVLLVLFAAGLLAHGIHEFNEVGIIPAGIEHVWDMNFILDEKQPVGQLMTALFGYNANPALTEILAYAVYILGAWVAWKRLANPKRVSVEG